MKVFISWSGDLAKELGSVFRDWLPSVLQNVQPFFTADDIEKGARWNKDIASELEESKFGIICMTRENLSRPWLMFEAGALSKNLDVSNVCPILFGVDNTDLEGPLVQFQASAFTKGDLLKLVRTINKKLEDRKLKDSVLNEVFDMWWPKLESGISQILEDYSKSSNQSELRTDRDILEEVLDLSRMQSRMNKRTVRISPAAVADLCEAATNTYNAVENGQLEEALSILGEMQTPIDYIVKNVGRSPKLDSKHAEFVSMVNASLTDDIVEFDHERPLAGIRIKKK